MTFDNGKEFVENGGMNTALKPTTNFADPITSWQQGSNKNFNGLLG
jgi:IS30 family transposase